MIFKRVLLTNDDGVDAAGLALLHRLASRLSDDVWIVAPDSDRSGTSNALTLHDPLRVTQREEKRYSVSGSPADCVVLATRHLLSSTPPSLVLSGINRGANIGRETILSGTVGAATMANLCDIPAIALSQLFEAGDVDWRVAETRGEEVLRYLATEVLSMSRCLNVNFPACAPSSVKGIAMTEQGEGGLHDLGVVVRQDTQNRDYHWISAQYKRRQFAEGSEGDALTQGFITVTPLQTDRTHVAALHGMRGKLSTTTPPGKVQVSD